MKDAWTEKLLLLFAFIFLDYIVTLTSISCVSQEANMFARATMKLFGIPLGLTLFSIFTSILLLTILYSSKFFLTIHNSPVSTIATFTLDVSLAWFVAGTHFSGATSWFWNASELLRHFIGAGIYILALIAIKVKSKRFIS